MSEKGSAKKGDSKKLMVRPRVKKKKQKEQNMSAQKKKSSGCGPAPKGDCEPGLTPPIPFIPPKVDDEEKPPMVEITIKKILTRRQLKTILRRRNSQLLSPLLAAGLPLLPFSKGFRQKFLSIWVSVTITSK